MMDLLQCFPVLGHHSPEGEMKSDKRVSNRKPFDKKTLESILSRNDPLQELIARANSMNEAASLPEEDEESPTPGFSFGMRMGCVREDAELSVNKMAKSLGISPSTWKNYEEDVTVPSDELIMRFCELYNVNPRWLMTNYGDMYK